MAEQRKLTVNLVFQGRKADEELPITAAYLISPAGTVVRKLATAKDCKLEVGADWKKQGSVVALGPDTDDLRQLRAGSLLQFRLETALPLWQQQNTIHITRNWWWGWFGTIACVSGRVRSCPWWQYPRELFAADSVATRSASVGATQLLPRLANEARLSLLTNPISPFCRPVCNGVVEVYERVCCCRLWGILDPRLPVLIAKLRECVQVWPPPPFPFPEPEPSPFPSPGPTPGPDPLPIDRASDRTLKLREATVDPATIVPPAPRLVEDLQVLESLSVENANRYVIERPYLLGLICTCQMNKKGETVLTPDGSFSFCYWRPFRFYLWGTWCTVSYAYKVRQWQENQWVYIYDGIASNDYFTQDEFANLVSRSFRARPCDTDPPPIDHDKPFVLLQDVGATRSYRLVSPVQSSADGIASLLAENAGLLDAPPGGGSAVQQLWNRPWSHTMRFRLYFHPGMQALGAFYYRICVVAADAWGNPLSGATPHCLVDPVSWLRYQYVGGQIQIESDSLGPHIVTDPDGNVQSGLFTIPYWDANHLWLSGQYHQSWNTLSETNGRHLVLLEVFDNQGRRLRPIGAGGSGTDADFDFLRWVDAVNTVAVPFASLIHVFWADKQPCYGDIEDLRKNGLPSVESCQFMSGNADATFSAGFRAFHAHGPSGEPFMWYYTMWYKRGLSGPSRTIQTSGENAPPSLSAGPPAVSAPQTFASMLNGETKCSFALNLRVYAKHTNGSRRIHEYDRHDQAAFALEIVP